MGQKILIGLSIIYKNKHKQITSVSVPQYFLIKTLFHMVCFLSAWQHFMKSYGSYKNEYIMQNKKKLHVEMDCSSYFWIWTNPNSH